MFSLPCVSTVHQMGYGAWWAAWQASNPSCGGCFPKWREWPNQGVDWVYPQEQVPYPRIWR